MSTKIVKIPDYEHLACASSVDTMTDYQLLHEPGRLLLVTVHDPEHFPDKGQVIQVWPYAREHWSFAYQLMLGSLAHTAIRSKPSYARALPDFAKLPVLPTVERGRIYCVSGPNCWGKDAEYQNAVRNARMNHSRLAGKWRFALYDAPADITCDDLGHFSSQSPNIAMLIGTYGFTEKDEI